MKSKPATDVCSASHPILTARADRTAQEREGHFAIPRELSRSRVPLFRQHTQRDLRGDTLRRRGARITAFASAFAGGLS